MKSCARTLSRSLFVTGILFSLAGGEWLNSARAQGSLAAAPFSALSIPMTQLLREIKAFSSDAEVQMLDSAGAEAMAVPAAFSMVDGKMRAEIDLSRTRSKDIPPKTASDLKEMGLDRMVSIVRPDKKMTIFIYPSLRGYAEAPMSREEAANLEKKYAVETQKLSQETIDGHSCEKNKVTVTADSGQKLEALVWRAKDLENFPIRMQMAQEDGTVLIHFRNVQLKQPDLKQFEAPAGFTKYASVEKLTQEGLMKALGR